MNLGGWQNIEDGAEVHVVPVNDLSPHQTRALACWCGPDRDVDYPLLILHNAKDGREAFETGERRLS